MTKIVGKIQVPAAGTPIQVAAQTLIRSAINNFQTVHAIQFQAVPSNTGKIYFGNQAMVKATYAGCGMVLVIPTTGFIPSWGITQETSPNGVDLSEIWIDADLSGDGVLVTVQVT